MEWVRGESIGHGSSAMVNLAIPRNCNSTQSPPLMAVKSCNASESGLLQNEKQIMGMLGNCPEIVQCYGGDFSVENGEKLYNLFLEYAKRGSLANQLMKSGGCFPESDVRRYTTSILQGIHHIHSNGFVHCDLKLQNILMFDNGAIKIADFGLAKRTGEKQNRAQIRGTPLYMSPESVNENEYESPADIWALGCAVVEMVTGKNGWNCGPDVNIFKLLIRIGTTNDVPEIPQQLSDEGKDFLHKCFVKDPTGRWTAEMLLNHPFLVTDDDDYFFPTKKIEEFSVSPRSPFNFPGTDSIPDSPQSDWWSESSCVASSKAAAVRIGQLVNFQVPHWSISENWVNVR